MKKTELTLINGWKFHLGDIPEAWYKGYCDDAWTMVTVPHDWSVTLPFEQTNSSGTGYLSGGIGWYRCRFRLPREYQGKQITLVFDGVYKNSQVWFNSYYQGKRPYGYTAFSYDVTPFAVFGEQENEISVRVTRTDLADSRWFTGSGITREVHVVIEEAVHPVRNGIFFVTESASSKGAEVRVSHELYNASAQEQTVSVQTLLYPQEKPGETAETQPVLQLEGQLTLGAQETKTLILWGQVEQPRLWSTEAPCRYQLVCRIAQEDGAYETAETLWVGIRTFRFDPEQGFFLNEVSQKLKGVCVHHDAGCLGAAVPKEVWRRRLLLLKKAGCNAIRTSHNPHSPCLYELCDELGLLMMGEAFDEWENPKNKWSTGHNVYPPKHEGYAEDFPQWHEADLTEMIRRDRNHPAVILWSIGNEIDYPNDPYCHPMFAEMTGNNDANKPMAERMYQPDRPNMERLAPIAAHLAAIVRRSDSTRPVTLAAAFPELSSYLHFFDALDVVGYNYKEGFYERDHARFPRLPILGSENSHSYDAWRAVTEHSYISGQFLWTGIDYLGEAHGWPIHGSSAGLLTLAGFPKQEYYKRQALWLSEPFAALVTGPLPNQEQQKWPREWLPLRECWNYEEGEQVVVRCYANRLPISLYRNGRCVARADQWNDFGCVEWELPYQPGRLSVRLGEDEQEYGILQTAGEPAALEAVRWRAFGNGEPQIECTQTQEEQGRSAACSQRTAVCASDADQDQQAADAMRIDQLEITLLDEKGIRCTCSDRSVAVRLEGEAELLGLENGDLADLTPYTAQKRITREGRLLAYIRAERGAVVRVILSAGDGIRKELTLQ